MEDKQEQYVGRKIAIFFDDLGRVSRKDGTCTSVSTQGIILDNKMLIPWTRVVRVEFEGGR